MAEKKTVQEAIKEIILKLRGKDIFKNMNQFWGLLDDLAPESVKERKIIKRSLDEDLLAVFVDDTKTVRQRIKILLDNLDDLGVTQNWADFIIEAFGMPLGWNKEIREMKLSRPVTPPSMLSPTSGKVSYADIVLNEDTLKHLGIIDKKILTTVNIPASFNTYVGTVYRITKIGDNIFENCDKLETVVIPDTVTEIGKSAFAGCKSLKDINIPNDVTKIDNLAFRGCSSLKKIIIPNNVIEIGFATFQDCELLENVILPDSLTKIDGFAFSNCKSFTNIIIPNKTDVALNAFWGCGNIEQFTLPSIFTSFSIFNDVALDENVLKQLGYDVSYNYKNNTSQTLSLKKNGQDVTSLNIPATYTYDGKFYRITKINNWVFAGCKSLTNVTIPSGITEIYSYAFYNCTNLTSVNIPENVVNIGEYSFYRCSLKSVTIPRSVTSMGSCIFYECKSLVNVVYNSYCNIPSNCFDSCTALKTVTIEQGLNYINNSAFRNCNSLTDVTIPDGVSSIYDYAFDNCTNLIISVPRNTSNSSCTFRNVKSVIRRP